MPRTALLALTLVLLLPGNAEAAFRAWDGGLTGNWNTATNWTGDTVPGSG